MILNLFLVSGVFLWTHLSSCGLLHGAWARLTADWPRDWSTLCDLSLLVSSSVWPRGSSPVSTMGRLMCPAQSINSPSLFPPWETQLSVLMCVWGGWRVCMLSRVWLFATLWTVIPQAPLPMEFSRQEYWSGLPCPPPGELPDSGIEPAPPTSPAWASPASPAWAGRFFTTVPPGKLS